MKVKIPFLELGPRQIRGWIPKRAVHSHKGDYGKILLLCGAVGYTGAPVLAALGAARTGAGLIFVGVPESVYHIVAGKLTEPVVFPLPDREGMLCERAIPEILRRLKGCDACLIGCGLGRSEGIQAVVEAVLREATCPVVLDADGINVLEGHIDILRDAACPLIVTPHEGEYLRMGGDLTDRVGGAKRMAKDLGITLVLKGHESLICGRACYKNRCGNPGMATGGSGDVLAGIIVSLLGQGLSPMKAAAAGCYLHGTAGDLCACELGQAGMLPTDLIEMLPRLLD